MNNKLQGVGALMMSQKDDLNLKSLPYLKGRLQNSSHGTEAIHQKVVSPDFHVFWDPLPKTSLKSNRNIIGMINVYGSLSCHLSSKFVFKIPYYCCKGLEERAG